MRVRDEFYTQTGRIRQGSIRNVTTTEVGRWRYRKFVQDAKAYVAFIGDNLVMRLDTFSSQELERLSNRLAEELIPNIVDKEKHVRWISRTLIVKQAEDIPHGWLHERSRSVQAAANIIGCQQVHLGWGNNAIVLGNISTIRDDDSLLYLKGLVDAESFWSDAEHLSNQAISISLRYCRLLESGSTRKHIRGAEDEIDMVAVGCAVLNANSDSYHTHAQGLRALVGSTLLDLWNFQDIVDATEKRLNDISELRSIQQRREGKRYRSLIETAIFILGSLELVSLALDFLEFAYNGNAGDVPEGGGIVSRIVHSAPPDNWIILAFTIALVLLLAYRRGKQ